MLLKRELSELELLERAAGGPDARITRLRDSVNKRKEELTARYESFFGYIDSVRDPFDRAALTLRYFYGMTWQRVAFCLGEYDEQYARRRCGKYFSEKRKTENDGL